MRYVQDDLKLFDFDAHSMRGCNFFKGILDYRERILPLNKHRILSGNAYQCLLCGGTEGEVLLEWEEGYQIIGCTTCDLATANFSVADKKEHIDIAYNNDIYYEKFEREIVAHYEYRKMNMGKERYSYIVERLNLDHDDLRLLDVGCGAGWFLSYLQDRGVECRGLEVNPMAVRFCQKHGLNVADGSLEDEPHGQYGVITMFDVLEHLDDPLSAVSAARDKLKPGGYLVAYTPNIHSIGYELMGSNQNTMLPFEHTCFFSDKAFRYLADKTSCEIYSVEVFGFDIMDYLLMKEHEDGYEYTTKLGDMMLLVQACIDKLRLGNHFRLTLRKPL